MVEIWKPVPYDARYMVSNFGNIKGPRREHLAGGMDKNGYRIFGVWNKGFCKTLKVHRVVAEAFLGQIPEGMQVNHKNGVKSDNRLENLEVVTASENVKHAFDVLGKKPLGKHSNRPNGGKHHNSKLTELDVAEIRNLYSNGMRQADLAAMFHTPQTNISKIVRGKAWAHVPR